MSLFAELKRRNIFRVAIAYVIVAWLVLQVADVVLNNIEAPAWVFQTIMLVLALGFPLVLVFSWAFELTPEGLKREHEVDRSQSITTGTGRKLDSITIAVLTLALGYFAFDKFVLSAVRDAALIESAVLAAADTDALDRSIAVLPFADMSPDSDQEYFSDGLSEELLNLLAKIPELRVAARTSAFSYKGKDVRIAQVGEELGVAHVLEGSVRMDGDQVRVTAQLIKADDGFHVWSETYDRTLDNIFAIQDEIASAVVTALRVRLLGAEPLVTETDPQAYALYLQGRHFDQQGATRGWTDAVAAFQQALEIDADYAPAWAGLASSSYSLADFSVTGRIQGQVRARSAADRAVALDPSLAEGWMSLAKIRFAYDWDWEGAETANDEALRLEPRNADVLGQASRIARGLGRVDEALSLAEQSVALDPVSSVAADELALSQFVARRFDEVEATYKRVLKISPGYSSGHSWTAMALLANDQPAAALGELEQESSIVWKTVTMPRVLYALGRGEEGDRALSRAIEAYGVNAAYQIAEVYAGRGANDDAFEWLERAYAQRDGGMLQLLLDPWLDTLHDDARWEPLLEKMDLLPYWREMRKGG